MKKEFFTNPLPVFTEKKYILQNRRLFGLKKKYRFGSLFKILVQYIFLCFKPLFDTVFWFYSFFDTIYLKYVWLFFHGELVPGELVPSVWPSSTASLQYVEN